MKTFIIFTVLFLLILTLASKVDHAIYENPINKRLIKAIIQVESSGNPKAISEKGAYGLMQIRHEVWVKELKKAGIITTKQCLFDPDKNVKAWSINHGHGYTSLVSGCIT